MRLADLPQLLSIPANSRGDKTPLELFLAGIRPWTNDLRALIGSRKSG
jgi:hypothetical protein